MSNNRRAGRLVVKQNGIIRESKGEFTYNFGRFKRNTIVGTNKVHGFSEEKLVPFIEGEITDSQDLDVKALLDASDETITLELANGKTFILKNAWYAGDGDIGTDEANIQLRFEGLDGDEF